MLENRRSLLSIREITFRCVVHPRHDNGVRLRSAEFLRPFLKTYEKALAIFDFEGSGVETQSPRRVELAVEESLTANGWQDRCAAVVLVPELEAWIWDEALSLAKAANLKMTLRQVRTLLVDRGFINTDEIKPRRPKEAFEFLLREGQTKRSSSLFDDLGKSIDARKCVDPGFQKFVKTLSTWFPAG